MIDSWGIKHIIFNPWGITLPRIPPRGNIVFAIINYEFKLLSSLDFDFISLEALPFNVIGALDLFLPGFPRESPKQLHLASGFHSLMISLEIYSGHIYPSLFEQYLLVVPSDHVALYLFFSLDHHLDVSFRECTDKPHVHPECPEYFPASNRELHLINDSLLEDHWRRKAWRLWLRGGRGTKGGLGLGVGGGKGGFRGLLRGSLRGLMVW